MSVPTLDHPFYVPASSRARPFAPTIVQPSRSTLSRLGGHPFDTEVSRFVGGEHLRIEAEPRMPHGEGAFPARQLSSYGVLLERIAMTILIEGDHIEIGKAGHRRA